METPLRATTVLIAGIAAALAANLAAALAFHHAGLPTALWDLHFWAIWPGGHAPDWMPVNDSWMPMRKAYEWLRAPHHGTLYQEIFFHQHIKFQYPPSSLLVFAVPDAFHIAVTDRVLNAIGWCAVVIEAAACAVLAHRFAGPTMTPRARLFVAAMLGLAVFSFHSVMWAFSLGQIQAWLNALFALAALAFAGGRQRTAGALIGLICLVKPQFGLFVLWAALRGKWRFLGGLTVAVGAGLALSLIWFGWDNHRDYLAALSFMNRHGEAYYPNSAVNGVMNRLLGNDDPFTVDKTAFPPFNAWIYYASLISSLAMIAFALFSQRKQGGTLFDFFAAAILFTIASPIAWTHHLGILPPVFAVAAIMAVRTRSSAVLLFVSYLASAIFIPPLSWAANGFGSLIYALPLFGALILVALLMRSRAAETSIVRPAT